LATDFSDCGKGGGSPTNLWSSPVRSTPQLCTRLNDLYASLIALQSRPYHEDWTHDRPDNDRQAGLPVHVTGVKGESSKAASALLDVPRPCPL